MNDTGRAIALASRLYGERASTAYAGYIHRDPMANTTDFRRFRSSGVL
jgi:hypothetical protein